MDEGSTGRVKCLAHEHNTMTLVRSQALSFGFRTNCTNQMHGICTSLYDDVIAVA